jgi:hypothetical protein
VGEFRWYRVARSNTPESHLVAVLLDAIPVLTSARFVIGDPEARCLGRTVPPPDFFGGRVIHGEEVVDVLRLLLADGCYWCELQSDHLIVHVSEHAVYLGITPGHPAPPPSLLAEPVAESPFAQDDCAPVEYQPVSADYWAGVERRLAGRGSLVLLSQWAAGLGGERWYHVRRAADLAVVQSELLPRSVVAVFDREDFAVIGESDAAEIGRLVEENDAGSGTLRWLPPGAGPRLHTETVPDEFDLRAKLAAPEVGTVLLSWPDGDTDQLSPAACADDDGVVRVRNGFG